MNSQTQEKYVAIKRSNSPGLDGREGIAVATGQGLGWVIHMINNHHDQYDEMELASCVLGVSQDEHANLLAKILANTDSRSCCLCPSGVWR